MTTFKTDVIIYEPKQGQSFNMICNTGLSKTYGLKDHIINAVKLEKEIHLQINGEVVKGEIGDYLIEGKDKDHHKIIGKKSFESRYEETND